MPTLSDSTNLLRPLGLACAAAILLASSAAFAQGDPNDGDANSAAAGENSARFQFLEALIARRMSEASVAQQRGDLCAIGFIAGPAGSFDIRLGIFNGAPERISHVIVDPFSALGNQSLLIESNFALAAPVGGTIADLYPDAATPGGPAVLSFTGFDFLESASWNMDPDTYDNPVFGATVQQMNNTRIEVVYEERLRCAGTLMFIPLLNASLAFIVQTFP